MDQNCFESVEKSVDRLIEAYEKVELENIRLKEELAASKSRQDKLKNRLDSLIEKIDRVVGG